MEKLVGEAVFEYLEFGTTLCDVDYLGEHDSHIFEDMELNGDQLLALFAGTLFD